MKKSGFFLGALLLVFSACGNQREAAEFQLKRAETLMQSQSYAEAKKAIDSVRIIAPKAFDQIKAGIQLLRKIELQESLRSLAYADSLLVVRQAEAELQKREFRYEKDTLYQSIGKYLAKNQQIERNVERCYLRSETDEKGAFQLASVYYGKKPIEHTAVRFEVPDGTFVESEPVAYDGGNNYRFEDGGWHTEVVTYKESNKESLIEFLTRYSDQRIKVTYKGKHPYVYYLDKQAKTAIRQTYAFSILLSEITSLEEGIRKTRRHIEDLQKRIAEKELPAQK